MGRMLPVECEHGVVLDWGDFGPCQDCGQHDEGDCPNHASCDVCLPDRPHMPPLERLAAGLLVFMACAAGYVCVVVTIAAIRCRL